MALFVQVAETGSLSRAAEELGCPTRGEPAPVRTGRAPGRTAGGAQHRRLYLTEPGQEFLRRSKAILADLHEAESAVNASTLNPTGTLRITASSRSPCSTSCRCCRNTRAAIRTVTVHVETANRYLDLIDHNIDVAIRTRESNRTRTSPSGGWRDAAHPGRRARLPGTRGYAAGARGPRAARAAGLHLREQPARTALHARRRDEHARHQGVLESNDGQVLRAAALEGLGILVQPTYILYDDIAAGRLVPVLDAWDLPRLTVNLAYPSRKHLSAKVRTFIDFIAEHFDRMDYERKWTSRFHP
jgi:DNA-binding transcriptional LysR family regulator